jgi:hypothetical protein
MNGKIIYLLLCLFLSVNPLNAGITAAKRFLQTNSAVANSYKLAYSAIPTTTGLTTWTCTGVVTVQSQTLGGAAYTVTADTTVNLTGGSGIHFFSDSGCTTEITSVTITNGTNSSNFYFQSGKQVSSTLTASATSYNPATQAYTVTAYYACTWLGGTTTYATTTNWSCGHVPTTTAGDIAVFDTNCTNCTPASPTSAQTPYGLWLTRDYTGTFNLGLSGTYTVQSGGLCRVDGGTLTQGTQAFTCSGAFTQRGGTVNGGGAAMTFTGAYNLVSGTFSAAASTSNTVAFNNASGLQMSGGTFNAGTGTITFAAASSSTISGGTFNSSTGNIAANGNITFSGGTFKTPSGAGTFTGASAKTYTISGGTVVQQGAISFAGALAMSSGTFTGGSSALSTLTLNLTGGSFTSTSGTFTITSNATFTAAAFNANAGLVLFNPTSMPTITLGSANFQDVTFQSSNVNFTLSGTGNVGGNLIINETSTAAWANNSMTGGTLNVTGNVTASTDGFSGTTLIRLTGKAAGQTLTSSTTSWSYGASLPSIEIAAGTNPVTFASNVAINAASYTVTSVGTFNNTSSTLYLYSNTNTFSLSPGTYNYNNVTMAGHTPTYNLNSTTLNVTGTLSLTEDDNYAPNDSINSGFINAYGNVTVDANGYDGQDQVSTNNSAILTLAGNASGQTLTGSGGWVPSLIVAAGSNAVTLSGTIGVNGNYTYTSSGTFTTTGSTLKIYLNTATATIKPGTVHYNNLDLSFGWHSTYDLNAQTFYADGNLKFGEQSYIGFNINNGTIAVKGNVTSFNYGNGGTGLIKLVGNSSGQTISTNTTGTSTTPYFPNLEIAASTNPVTISGTVYLGGNYTMTSVGTLTVTSSTVIFEGDPSAAGTYTLKFGSESYNNVTFGGDSQNFDLNATTAHIGGNVVLSDTHYTGFTVSNGTIQVTGNASITNYGKAGSAQLKFVGASPTFTIASGASVPTGNLTVSISGTLTLGSVYTQTGSPQSMSVTSGAVNMNKNNMTIVTSLTLSSGTSVTRGTGGVLTVNGSTVGAGAYSGGTIF